jgi:cytochrome c
MDSFEMTKIAGAVFAALLLIVGTKVMIEERTEKGAEKAGYALPGTEKPAAEAKADAKAAPAAKAEGAALAETKTAEAPKAAAAAPEAAPAKTDAAPAAAGAGAGIAALLAKASADNGKAIFGKCKSCHSPENGKNLVGPSLYGVVNRAKGTMAGYANYSEGMKGKGGNWTFEDISAFLTNPKAFVAGTKMGFAGLTEASDRADVIAYLATLADTPVALPK